MKVMIEQQKAAFNHLELLQELWLCPCVVFFAVSAVFLRVVVLSVLYVVFAVHTLMLFGSQPKYKPF